MVSTAQDPRSSTHRPDRPRVHFGLFDGHEELRIPAAWPGLTGFSALLVSLPLWIGAASFKFGPKILYSGWTGLLLVFAIATCCFVVYAILQIAWWLGGAERLAVIGQNLLVRHTILGVPIVTRSYRGEDIRFLDAIDVPRAGRLAEPFLPFASSGRCGRLKFFYRSATVYLGHGLGAADGKCVAAWLAQKLPSTASS